MSDPGSALASAARALVGAPFRLHGRDPATGVDCVGLVAAALEGVGFQAVAPTGYGLRNLGIDHWLPFAARCGLVEAIGPIRSGDVLLIGLPHAQHHLVIAIDQDSVVHAHAGLRRVVIQPLDTAWQIRCHWRMAIHSEG